MKRVLFICTVLSVVLLSGKCSNADEAALLEIKVKSSLDDSLQPSMFWAPESAKKQKTPLFIFLHSWSGNYKQNNASWFGQAVDKGWIFLHPDFRGPNYTPKACGSKFARRDILDAIDYVIKHYQVDESRIYLAGSSGGGHMTMQMAAYFPERFTAASAWVGISDIAEWYQFHTPSGKPGNYAQHILRALGSKPGTSSAIDADYKDRSPLFHLHQVGKLPLEMSAGVKDGKTGSVPIQHTLKAFNVVAKANGFEQVSDAEIDQLWKNEKLDAPRKSDQERDPILGRDIKLRRVAGPARVTIFEGGHEGLPVPAVAWLEKHVRKTKTYPIKP